MALLSNITSDAAVDDWVYRFPTLFELDEQLVWLRPMMNTIAKRLLSESGWGLKMRLYSGAFMSVMDMVSDIAMIIQYFEEGNVVYAKAVLSSIVAHLCFQLLFVIGANHKKSALSIFYEIAVVVLCIKPAIDAARVAGGKEQQPDEVADPLTELTFSKGMEIFFEGKNQPTTRTNQTKPLTPQHHQTHLTPLSP